MTKPRNHRDRLLRILQNQPDDRLPDVEFGAWSQTNDRWSQEDPEVDSCKGLCRPFYCLDRFFYGKSVEWGFHFRLTGETGQPWNDIEVKI